MLNEVFPVAVLRKNCFYIAPMLFDLPLHGGKWVVLYNHEWLLADISGSMGDSVVSKHCSFFFNVKTTGPVVTFSLRH